MRRDSGVLFLSDKDLEALGIATSDVADAIETALVAKARGQLWTAPKSVVLPGDGRYAMSTLALGDDGYVVVKQVTVCPDNAGRGLPSINGAIMVLDAGTGLLRAVLGANWITAVRTAALSLVAARRLADPGSETMAFVGTGVQARAHLDAFAGSFPLRRIRAFGRGQANLDRLCNLARDKGLDACVCDTGQEALRSADLVVSSITLDFSIEPFLDAEGMPSNAFAAITDACVPWFPDSMNRFQTIFVDDRVQEQQSGNPMVAPDLISGDLTDLVTAGPARSARPAAFAFRGLSLGDYAAAVLALRRAEGSGA